MLWRPIGLCHTEHTYCNRLKAGTPGLQRILCWHRCEPVNVGDLLSHVYWDTYVNGQFTFILRVHSQGLQVCHQLLKLSPSKSDSTSAVAVLQIANVAMWPVQSCSITITGKGSNGPMGKKQRHLHYILWLFQYFYLLHNYIAGMNKLWKWPLTNEITEDMLNPCN